MSGIDLHKDACDAFEPEGIDCAALSDQVSSGEISAGEFISQIEAELGPIDQTFYFSKNCTHCQEAKAALGNDIDSGIIIAIDVDLDPGLGEEITKKHGGVPTLIADIKGMKCEVDPATRTILRCEDGDGN